MHTFPSSTLPWQCRKVVVVVVIVFVPVVPVPVVPVPVVMVPVVPVPVMVVTVVSVLVSVVSVPVPVVAVTEVAVIVKTTGTSPICSPPCFTSTGTYTPSTTTLKPLLPDRRASLTATVSVAFGIVRVTCVPRWRLLRRRSTTALTVHDDGWTPVLAENALLTASQDAILSLSDMSSKFTVENVNLMKARCMVAVTLVAVDVVAVAVVAVTEVSVSVCVSVLVVSVPVVSVPVVSETVLNVVAVTEVTVLVVPVFVSVPVAVVSVAVMLVHVFVVDLHELHSAGQVDFMRSPMMATLHSFADLLSHSSGSVAPLQMSVRVDVEVIDVAVAVVAVAVVAVAVVAVAVVAVTVSVFVDESSVHEPQSSLHVSRTSGYWQSERT
jgi:hypothetical protein